MASANAKPMTGNGFTGNHRCKLDAKGRVSVPVPVRTGLTSTGGQSFVVYRSLDVSRPILEAGDLSLRAKLEGTLARIPLQHPGRQKLERHILGSLTILAIDNDGRTVLPDSLRRLTKFGPEIVYVGRGEVFEIWDAELWDREMEQASISEDDISLFNSMWEKENGPVEPSVAAPAAPQDGG